MSSSQSPPTDQGGRVAESAAAIDLPDAVSSPRAKLVYVYLAMRGETSVQELAAVLDMQTITLYSILQTLGEYGVVSKQGDVYRPVA